MIAIRMLHLRWGQKPTAYRAIKKSSDDSDMETALKYRKPLFHIY